MSFFRIQHQKPSVIHQISLNGLGGVQQSFVDYYRLAREKSSFHHVVFGTFDPDPRFGTVEDYYNLHRSTALKIQFLASLCSSRHLIHFYNNLGSRTVRRLLCFIPNPSCLFHERGLAWNIPIAQGQIVRDNAAKAKIILANSKATKVLLVKKFGIPDEKIKVLYNGIHYVKPPGGSPSASNGKDSPLTIGYIGRLDTPKGVHSLVEAARLVTARRNGVRFLIAGSGPLEGTLRHQSIGIKNLNFLGAVSNPYEFLSHVDMIVVPSIREPFGNVIVEAGLMRKAVIASNVDGIAEIIEHQVSGLLIDPTLPIKRIPLPPKAAPYPEVIVNPKTKDLAAPREIDPEMLAEVLEAFIDHPDRYRSLGEKLNETVIARFNLNRYHQELEDVYLSLRRL